MASPRRRCSVHEGGSGRRSSGLTQVGIPVAGMDADAAGALIAVWCELGCGWRARRAKLRVQTRVSVIGVERVQRASAAMTVVLCMRGGVSMDLSDVQSETRVVSVSFRSRSRVALDTGG